MRQLRWTFLALFFALLASTLPVAATNETGQPVPGVAQLSGESTSVHSGNIPANWWSQVQEDIRQSEYEITWQEETGLPDLPAAYQAPNRAQGFRTYFTTDGIRLVPRVGGLAWDERLSVDRGASPSEPAGLSLQANQVEYQWPGMVERYTNTPEGVRHQVILLESGAGRVRPIDLVLSGGLSTRLDGQEQTVELVSVAGETILRYGQLVATDARGRSLPLRLGLSSGSFTIQLDVSDALYPVVITSMLAGSIPSPDGLSQSPNWSAESNQAGANFGWGSAAGDVNGDGYSDAIIGAGWYDNGQAQEGRAFLYLGSANGLESTPAWTTESNQSEAYLGDAVGMTGDVNGDGYADVAIAAYWYDNGQVEEGRVYVYHGSSAGLGSSPNWIAEGNQDGAYFGTAVATGGDVNGDGYSDLLVSARRFHNGQTDEGAAWAYYGSAAGLSTSPNWHVESNQAYAQMGYGLDTAGDVNGDGYADVLVGTYWYDNGQVDEGKVDAYYGSAAGLSTTPNWTVESNQANAGLGIATSTAGDVNGDGYADVVVGAWQYDNGQTDEGRAYLYYGSPLGLNPTPSWTAEGNQAGAQFGRPVGTAGDVNGDGYADVMVGATWYDNGQVDEGGAFVYCGSPTGLGVSACWQAEGNQADSAFGIVSTAGDVNGDGYADIIVGAHRYDNGQTDEGVAFVYHGSAVGLGSAPAWTAEGNQAGAGFGGQIHTAGDVNGDGYADVLVSATWYDNGQADEGRVFLYSGSVDGLSGIPAWTVESDQAGSDFGTAVGTAGDLNGDGYDDVVVGARYYDNGQTDEGRAYVYFGSPGGLPNTPDWTAEGDQVNASFGRGASTAGDVNGDGYADLLIGAPYYTNGQAEEGRAYLYLGSATGPGPTPDWTAECNVADSYCGWRVNPAGDVNADGYSDIIIGARRYTNGQTREGAAFVYHGSPGGLSANPDWRIESNQAEAQLGYSADTAGDVNGDGYADVIVGAHLYDNGQTDEGAIFAYNGSAAGLSSTPSWRVEANQAYAELGVGLDGGGDVNGDGYADIVVGSWLYDNGQADEGMAWAYYGSPSGLSSTANWRAEGNQAGAGFGDKTAMAGDVNGDGYADVIIGAPYYDNGQADEGRAYMYYGNGGDGLDLVPQQLRTDGSAPIAQLGMSDLRTAVQLWLTGRMPLGREEVKLQWQVAPLGVPFTATGVISGTSVGWTDVLTTGVVISQNVAGLTLNTPYHWRGRLLYRPGNRMGQPAGRWVHIPWNSWTEEDFRTDWCVAVQDATFSWAPVTPTVGSVITFTGQATGTLPLAYQWDLGDGTTASGVVVNHVYAQPGWYSVTLTVTNGCGQEVVTDVVEVVCAPILGADFTWAPVTPTVGSVITFTGQATSTLPLTFTWDLGDGTTAGGAVVNHVYSQPGWYSVTLTVTNSCGQEEVTATVEVVCAPILGADFTWAPLTPTVGAVVTFTGQATSTLPLTFTWDLGDGTTAGGAVVNHVYSQPGWYSVTLTVTNSCGQEVVTNVVEVVCAPILGADFTWTPVTPTVGAVVTFTGQATSTLPLTYSWDLGDGTMASGAVVNHVYSQPGWYSVTLTVTNGCGQEVVTDVVEVVCAPILGAGFSWEPVTPTVGSVVTFTGQATSTLPLTYSWDLGDGTTAGGAVVNHIYSLPGWYSVTLTVTNSCGQEVVTDVVEVVCAPILGADFSWEPVTPTVGAVVTFTGQATSTLPLTYSWDLGDGTMASGAVVNHVYSQPGWYSVTLTVTNACSQEVVTHTLRVRCDPPQGVGFDWTPITPTIGQNVTFTGYATGTLPLSYAWDLDDGTTANGAVVNHAYTVPGWYTVTLTVTNACGEEVVTHTLWVRCDPPQGVGFDWIPITPTVGQNVTFTGYATGTAPLAYAWDFGDGTGATGVVVAHSYGMAGSYTVTLTVTNDCGVQVLQDTITVAAPLWRVYLPTMLRQMGSGVFFRR